MTVTRALFLALLLLPFAKGQLQDRPGEGNGEALRTARSSPLIQSALRSIIALAGQISDPRLRAETLEAVGNPAVCVLSRAGLTDNGKDALLEQLAREGLLDRSAPGVKTGVFPPLLDEGSSCPHLPQAFFSAPGSGANSHHSYPGGLVIHELFNAAHDVALGVEYRGLFGHPRPDGLPVAGNLAGAASSQRADVRLSRDILIEAPLWHDWAKTFVFQWNRDGSEFTEFNFGGNGTTDNYGHAGDSRTGAHHILGGAETMKRGFPPDVVVAQLSAHGAPVLGNEWKVVNWIRAAAILAGVDPVHAGYLQRGSDGSLHLRPFRAEYAIHNLSDADFVLSIPAVNQADKMLRQLAPEFGYDVHDTARYNTRFRNVVLSYESAERLLMLETSGGLDRVRAELKLLRHVKVM